MPNRVTARRCAPPRRQFVIQKARHDQKVYASPFSCQLVRPGRRSLSVLYLRRCHGSHWGGSWGRSFSAGSWGHSLRRRCIECSGKYGPVFGRIPGRGFRMGWVAESATRNIAPKRDALSSRKNCRSRVERRLRYSSRISAASSSWVSTT